MSSDNDSENRRAELLVKLKPALEQFGADISKLSHAREKLGARFSATLSKRFYDEGQNPLYVWEAYQSLRQSSLPLDDWILDYFDRAAAKLADAQQHCDSDVRQGEPATIIAECFEMKRPGRSGRKTVFSDRRGREWERYASDVFRRMCNGDKFIIACEDVAKDHKVHASTVRRAFKRLSVMFPDIDDELSESR